MRQRYGLRAWSSRDVKDNRRGLGDPEARLGRGKRGFYLGYRSLFLVDVEGFPLGYVEAPANVNEKTTRVHFGLTFILEFNQVTARA